MHRVPYVSPTTEIAYEFATDAEVRNLLWLITYSTNRSVGYDRRVRSTSI